MNRFTRFVLKNQTRRAIANLEAYMQLAGEPLDRDAQLVRDALASLRLVVISLTQKRVV